MKILFWISGFERDTRKSHSPLRGSHENLRVFVDFPPKEKPPGFSIPRSILAIQRKN